MPMLEALSSLPPLSESLILGFFGAALTVAGSVLCSGLRPTPRKVGSCFCILGLLLMVAGFLCLTSNTSLLAYAQKV